MDPRFDSVALLALLLSFPDSSSSDGAREDIFGVYLETLERRFAGELADVYAAFNDLTECISKLSIKIHAAGLAAPAADCLHLNAAYKKTIHDLLQVSAALLARIALSVAPPNPAVDKAFKLMRPIWPPKTLPQRAAALAAARHLWRVHVNELYTHDLKLRKICAELNNSTFYLWSIADRLYALRPSSAPAPPSVPGLQSAIRWRVDDSFVALSAQEAESLRDDIVKLAEVQNHLAHEVDHSADCLTNMEQTHAQIATTTSQANQQLAEASTLQAARWPFTGAAIGAAIGSAIGIFGGPPGVILGASAGGALGGTAGNAMKNRHHEIMTQVVRNAPFPSMPLDHSSDARHRANQLPSEPTRSLLALEGWSPNSAIASVPDLQDLRFSAEPSPIHKAFSSGSKELATSAARFGCQSMPVKTCAFARPRL